MKTTPLPLPRGCGAGIRIHTIGIGTPEGAPIRIAASSSATRRATWSSRSSTRRDCAASPNARGGVYVRATKQSIGLEEIVAGIGEMERTELATVRFEEFDERYRPLVWAALLLLLLEFALLDRRNTLLARFNIFREAAPRS